MRRSWRGQAYLGPNRPLFQQPRRFLKATLLRSQSRWFNLSYSCSAIDFERRSSSTSLRLSAIA